MHARRTIRPHEAGDLDDVLQYLWHEHLKKEQTPFPALNSLILRSLKCMQKPHQVILQTHRRQRETFEVLRRLLRKLTVDVCFSSANSAVD